MTYYHPDCVYCQRAMPHKHFPIPEKTRHWEEELRTIPCRRCDAPYGDPCRDRSGLTRFTAHTARLNAYNDGMKAAETAEALTTSR